MSNSSKKGRATVAQPETLYPAYLAYMQSSKQTEVIVTKNQFVGVVTALAMIMAGADHLHKMGE